MSRVEVTQPSAPLSDGMLQTVLPLSATSQFVKDNVGNFSAFSLSTSLVGIGTTSPLGLLHLKTTGATTRMVIDGDAGQSRIITYRTSGLQRFGLYVNNTAESGSNVGSDFAIRAYNDAGTLLSTPLFIKRSTQNVGIGTTSPTAKLQVENATTSALVARFKDALAATTYIDVKTDSTLTDRMGLYWGSDYRFLSKQGASLFINCEYNAVFANGLQAVTTITPSEVQVGTISGARLGIKGSGSTSATTSLLVQNSGGNESLKVLDNRAISLGGSGKANLQISSAFDGSFNFGTINFANFDGTTYGQMVGINASNSSFIFGGTSVNSSAKVQFDSTTQGFLPPRMTTVQKNAIGTPAAGLIVYDTTLNKLCVRTAAAWETITSV